MSFEKIIVVLIMIEAFIFLTYLINRVCSCIEHCSDGKSYAELLKYSRAFPNAKSSNPCDICLKNGDSTCPGVDKCKKDGMATHFVHK